MDSWESESPMTGEDALQWLLSLSPEDRKKPLQMLPHGARLDRARSSHTYHSWQRGAWNRVHRAHQETTDLVLEA